METNRSQQEQRWIARNWAPMSETIKITNQYNVAKACEHCEGVVRHESWCVSESPAIYYAWAIVHYSGIVTEEDRIHLHGLGVAWRRHSE